MAGTGYTPTGGIFHGTITVPVDGDPAVVASVNTQGLKFLADNARYLYNNTFLELYNWRVVPAPIYDADISINPQVSALGGHNVIDAVTLTNDRTYEIDDVGCEDGSWCFLINRTAHTIGLNAPGGAPPLTTRLILGDWSFFIRSGGTWRQGASSIYNNGISTTTVGVTTISGNAALFNNIVGQTGTFNSVIATTVKATNVSATVGVSAPLVFATNLSVSGTAEGGKFFGLLQFVVSTPTDADHTLSVSGVTGANVYFGVVMAPNVRAWSLPTANGGDWVFIRQTGTGRIDVKDDVGALLISLNNPTPANTCWVLCVTNAVNWFVMASGVNAV